MKHSFWSPFQQFWSDELLFVDKAALDRVMIGLLVWANFLLVCPASSATNGMSGNPSNSSSSSIDSRWRFLAASLMVTYTFDRCLGMWINLNWFLCAVVTWLPTEMDSATYAPSKLDLLVSTFHLMLTPVWYATNLQRPSLNDWTNRLTLQQQQQQNSSATTATNRTIDRTSRLMHMHMQSA